MTSLIDRLVLAGVVLCGHAAYADGVITMHGREVVATPHRGEHACDDDPDCATTLLRALTGLAFGTLTATLGGDSAGTGLAGGVTLDAVSGDYPVGRFEVGRIEAHYLPDHPTERIRLTIANADVLFPCRDQAGELHAPISGQTKYACVESRLGLGGALGELAWDPAAGRLAVRWAELRAVVNLVGAPDTMAYLRGHLDASLGVAAESVWPGNGEMRTGADHVARAVVAVTGVVRSDSARWEARARAEARPVVVGTAASITDLGVLASGAVLYHLAAGSSTTVSTGVEVRADHWSDPSTSIGALDSALGKTTVFLGALVEVRHESPR